MLKSFSGDVNNPKIAIIITDGASFEPDQTTKAAFDAKMAGVVMFVIGVGDDVNPHETSSMSSDPDSRYLFQVTDFRALQSIGDQFHGRNCTCKRRFFFCFACLFSFFFFKRQKDVKSGSETAELCKSYYVVILFHFLVHFDDA